MLKVGITGGIGSGKSTVCQVFHSLGIPVFYADEAAKWLMQHDEQLTSSIKKLLGDDAYKNGNLDRPFVASIVFSNPEMLEDLNDLVHPATMLYGQEWMKQQQAPYVMKEAAIFFESGTYKEMDIMIGVYAPVEKRFKRAMQRNHTTEEDIRERMALQMDEIEKMKRCDYVITNDDAQAVLPQVLRIHQLLLERANR
jgi:dephospho-CoA kinase